MADSVAIDVHIALVSEYNSLFKEHTDLKEKIDRIEAEKQNIVDEKQKVIDQQHKDIQELKKRIKNCNSNRFYHQRKADERNEKVKLLNNKLKEEGVTKKVRQIYRISIYFKVLV